MDQCLRGRPDVALTMTADPHIASLHRDYVRLTGLDVAMDMARERAWADWLNYRRNNDPFTATDLALVIASIQRGIRKGDRNPGALRFRNLIADHEAFDEERALARSAAAANARKPKVDAARESVLNATGRPPDPGTGPNTTTAAEASERALDTLRKIKETL